MKSPKNINRKRDKRIVALLQFLFRHGEKCAAGILIVAAVWFALQALNYQPLTWQPGDLTALSKDAEETINNNDYTIADENVMPFDYAVHAEQIRERIPFEPYQSDAVWHPAIHPAPQPRGGFEVLAAESLRGEAVRRTVLSAPEKPANQWQPPPQPETQPAIKDAVIWVNLYGMIPLWQQWDIYNQVFDHVQAEMNRPKYIYYELQKAEIKPKEELIWQPVIVYPNGEWQKNREMDTYSDFLPDRLIPFGPPGTAQEQYASHSLLFSDFDIEPAKTYAYRIRLYLVNPNYNQQEISVEAGVDTKNELVRSGWSSFAKVYVPDRTLVQIQSVTPTDYAEFPRQAAPLRPMSGTFLLDYFDIELGQSLPLVERRDIRRGMLCNLSKDEANRLYNIGKTPDEVVDVHYPDAGLRSGVCVMDLSGGRKLQKKPSREAQTSPELLIPGKALLLMPNGTMQMTTTEQNLFR